MNSTEIVSILTTIATVGKELSKNKNVRSFLCGTYSDGSLRNVSDAIAGEFVSPKEKSKYLKKKHKKKKKKHKKKKKNVYSKYKFVI